MMSWPQVALSAASIAISLIALLTSLAGHRAARARYVTDLRASWEQLHPHWSRSLLLSRGSDDYYTDASDTDREEVRQLEVMASAAKWEKPPYEGLTEWINELRAESRHTRAVCRFLAHCSDLVLSGRISVDDVYRILGPDVSSHGNAIRWMCGTTGGENYDRNTEFDTAANSSYYGEQDLILALIDLLWAETVRQGDNKPHSLSAVAAHKKQFRTGKLCRRRVFKTSWHRGRNWLRAWMLSRSLRDGEIVPVKSILRSDTLWPYIDLRLVASGPIPGIRNLLARFRVKKFRSRHPTEYDDMESKV